MPIVRRPGIELYYSDMGAGAEIVLHMGGAGDGRMWQLAGYLDGLAGFRVIALDHRGHGRSSKPLGVGEHRLDEYVDDLLAILDASVVEKAALVGYSDGVDVVLAIAARRPDRVAAVVGVGALGAPGDGLTGRLARAAHVRAVGTVTAIEDVARTEAEVAPRWLLDNLMSTDTEMFALELEGWADSPGIWQTLPEVAQPTLLICGELEEPDAALHLQAAVAALQNGRSLTLHRVGHLGVFWRADLVLPAMVSFLREHLPAMP